MNFGFGDFAYFQGQIVSFTEGIPDVIFFVGDGKIVGDRFQCLRCILKGFVLGDLFPKQKSSVSP